MIIAGTGHRPSYCPCLYDKQHPWLISLRGRIKNKLIETGPELVISGMAIGFDTWLAQEAIKLKIPLSCYVPFIGQGSNWPDESRLEYERILDNAYEVKFISEKYSKQAFLKRDEAMVDNCDKVMALYNPIVKTGGTYHTVTYAIKKHKEIINVWE